MLAGAGLFVWCILALVPWCLGQLAPSEQKQLKSLLQQAGAFDGPKTNQSKGGQDGGDIGCEPVPHAFCAVVVCSAPEEDPEGQQQQHIISLSIAGPSANGTLEMLDGFDFPYLVNFTVSDTELSGELPAVLKGPSLQRVAFLRNHMLNAVLPVEYGQPLAGDSATAFANASTTSRFPKLESLVLSSSWWRESLPDSWGAAQAFPALRELRVTSFTNAEFKTFNADTRSIFLKSSTAEVGLTGRIPDSWLAPDSFPSLRTFDLTGNTIEGGIPPALLRIHKAGDDADAPLIWPNLEHLIMLRQRSSRLCAHIGHATRFTSRPPRVDGTNSLRSMYPLRASTASAAPAPASQPPSCVSADDNIATCEASLALAHQMHAYSQANSGSWVTAGRELVPESAAVFKHMANDTVLEVFLGLCDLPEMIAFRRVSRADTMTNGEDGCSYSTVNYCEWGGVSCEDVGGTSSFAVRQLLIGTDPGQHREPYFDTSELSEEEIERLVPEIAGLYDQSMQDAQTGLSTTCMDARDDNPLIPELNRAGAFKRLRHLMIGTETVGTLPRTWANRGLFESLETLRLLGDNMMLGVSRSWDTVTYFNPVKAPVSFPKLRTFHMVSVVSMGCRVFSYLTEFPELTNVVYSRSSNPLYDKLSEVQPIAPCFSPPKVIRNAPVGMWRDLDVFPPLTDDSSGVKKLQTFVTTGNAVAMDVAAYSCLPDPVEYPNCRMPNRNDAVCEDSVSSLALLSPTKDFICGSGLLPDHVHIAAQAIKQEQLGINGDGCPPRDRSALSRNVTEVTRYQFQDCVNLSDCAGDDHDESENMAVYATVVFENPAFTSARSDEPVGFSYNALTFALALAYRAAANDECTTDGHIDGQPQVDGVLLWHSNSSVPLGRCDQTALVEGDFDPSRLLLELEEQAESHPDGDVRDKLVTVDAITMAYYCGSELGPAYFGDEQVRAVRVPAMELTSHYRMSVQLQIAFDCCLLQQMFVQEQPDRDIDWSGEPGCAACLPDGPVHRMKALRSRKLLASHTSEEGSEVRRQQLQRIGRVTHAVGQRMAKSDEAKDTFLKTLQVLWDEEVRVQGAKRPQSFKDVEHVYPRVVNFDEPPQEDDDFPAYAIALIVIFAVLFLLAVALCAVPQSRRRCLSAGSACGVTKAPKNVDVSGSSDPQLPLEPSASLLSALKSTQKARSSSKRSSRTWKAVLKAAMQRDRSGEDDDYMRQPIGAPVLAPSVADKAARMRWRWLLCAQRMQTDEIAAGPIPSFTAPRIPFVLKSLRRSELRAHGSKASPRPISLRNGGGPDHVLFLPMPVVSGQDSVTLRTASGRGTLDLSRDRLPEYAEYLRGVDPLLNALVAASRNVRGRSALPLLGSSRSALFQDDAFGIYWTGPLQTALLQCFLTWAEPLESPANGQARDLPDYPPARLAGADIDMPRAPYWHGAFDSMRHAQRLERLLYSSHNRARIGNVNLAHLLESRTAPGSSERTPSTTQGLHRRVSTPSALARGISGSSAAVSAHRTALPFLDASPLSTSDGHGSGNRQGAEAAPVSERLPSVPNSLGNAVSPQDECAIDTVQSTGAVSRVDIRNEDLAARQQCYAEVLELPELSLDHINDRGTQGDGNGGLSWRSLYGRPTSGTGSINDHPDHRRHASTGMSGTVFSQPPLSVAPSAASTMLARMHSAMHSVSDEGTVRRGDAAQRALGAQQTSLMRHVSSGSVDPRLCSMAVGDSTFDTELDDVLPDANVSTAPSLSSVHNALALGDLSSVHLSRTFSWPVDGALANLDLRTRPVGWGDNQTSSYGEVAHPLFLSSDVSHRQVLYRTVIYMHARIEELAEGSMNDESRRLRMVKAPPLHPPEEVADALSGITENQPTVPPKPGRARRGAAQRPAMAAIHENDYTEDEKSQPHSTQHSNNDIAPSIQLQPDPIMASSSMLGLRRSHSVNSEVAKKAAVEWHGSIADLQRDLEAESGTVSPVSVHSEPMHSYKNESLFKAFKKSVRAVMNLKKITRVRSEQIIAGDGKSAFMNLDGSEQQSATTSASRQTAAPSGHARVTMDALAANVESGNIETQLANRNPDYFPLPLNSLAPTPSMPGQSSARPTLRTDESFLPGANNWREIYPPAQVSDVLSDIQSNGGSVLSRKMEMRGMIELMKHPQSRSSSLEAILRAIIPNVKEGQQNVVIDQLARLFVRTPHGHAFNPHVPDGVPEDDRGTVLDVDDVEEMVAVVPQGSQRFDHEYAAIESDEPPDAELDTDVSARLGWRHGGGRSGSWDLGQPDPVGTTSSSNGITRLSTASDEDNTDAIRQMLSREGIGQRTLRRELERSATNGNGMSADRAASMRVTRLINNQPLMPDTDLNIDLRRLQFKSMLGRGAYGEVWFGTWTAHDGAVHEVAIKRLIATLFRDTADNRRARGEFLEEMKLMTWIRHKNIVHCFGGHVATAQHDFDCMVLEYMPGGSLDHYIHTHRAEHRLKVSEVLNIAFNIADALSYLHPHVVHRDLKPCNVLLDDKGRPKLADFGISTMKQVTYISQNFVGTAAYTAPEVWQNAHVDEKSDIFALGVLLWECLVGARPFQGLSVFHVMMAITRSQGGQSTSYDMLRIPQGCPEKVASLLRRCWAPDPRLRLSSQEIVFKIVDLSMRVSEEARDMPVPFTDEEAAWYTDVERHKKANYWAQAADAAPPVAAGARPSKPPLQPGLAPGKSAHNGAVPFVQRLSGRFSSAKAMAGGLGDGESSGLPRAPSVVPRRIAGPSGHSAPEATDDTGAHTDGSAFAPRPSDVSGGLQSQASWDVQAAPRAAGGAGFMLPFMQHGAPPGLPPPQLQLESDDTSMGDMVAPPSTSSVLPVPLSPRDTSSADLLPREASWGAALSVAPRRAGGAGFALPFALGAPTPPMPAGTNPTRPAIPSPRSSHSGTHPSEQTPASRSTRSGSVGANELVLPAVPYLRPVDEHDAALSGAHTANSGESSMAFQVHDDISLIVSAGKNSRHLNNGQSGAIAHDDISLCSSAMPASGAGDHLRAHTSSSMGFRGNSDASCATGSAHVTFNPSIGVPNSPDTGGWHQLSSLSGQPSNMLSTPTDAGSTDALYGLPATVSHAQSLRANSSRSIASPPMGEATGAQASAIVPAVNDNVQAELPGPPSPPTNGAQPAPPRRFSMMDAYSALASSGRAASRTRILTPAEPEPRVSNGVVAQEHAINGVRVSMASAYNHAMRKSNV